MIKIASMDAAIEKALAETDRKKLISELTQQALQTRSGMDVILDWLADPNDNRPAEEVLDEACKD